MKSNKEKVDELERLKEEEIAPIEKKWNEQINALYQKFTVEDLEKLGWVKGDFYAAGDQYLFKKGNVEVRVYPKDLTGFLTVMPYWESWHGSFVDLAHLEEYYNNKTK